MPQHALLAKLTCSRLPSFHLSGQASGLPACFFAHLAQGMLLYSLPKSFRDNLGVPRRCLVQSANQSALTGHGTPKRC